MKRVREPLAMLKTKQRETVDIARKEAIKNKKIKLVFAEFKELFLAMCDCQRETYAVNHSEIRAQFAAFDKNQRKKQAVRQWNIRSAKRKRRR